MLIGQNSYPRTDQTGVLGPIAGGFQGAVRRHNLGGIFDMSGDPAATEGTSINAGTMTAINSEAVFIANLWRSMTGQAPLPAQSAAPSVNVGLTAEAKNMLLIGGGVLAFILLRKKHR